MPTKPAPRAERLPEPPAQTPAEEAERKRVIDAWRTAAQAATVGIFVLLFGAFLEIARPLFLPVVSAFVIGTMLTPAARYAADHRVPPVLFSILIVAVIVGLIHLVTVAVAGPIADLVKQIPDLGPALRDKFSIFEPALAALRHVQDAVAPDTESPVKLDLSAVVPAAVGVVTPALGEMVVFLATLFLFLLSGGGLRRHLILFFPEKEDRLTAIRIFNDVERKLQQYIGAVTAINAALGVVTALLVYVVGLPKPILFGVLAFVCNFVPYIGAGVTLLTLFGTGLIVFPTLAYALVAPVLFLVITTIEGQLLTPHLLGQRFTVNPLLIFLSLAFWLWLWGPIGGFLSVPLLIIGLAILEHAGTKSEGELPG
jgi:predicted PurR-regulated permease PerM